MMPVFTMNFRAALAGLALLVFTLPAFGQGIVTVRPQVDRQSTREVNIVRVELTGPYTVLTFQYRIRGPRQPQPAIPPSMRDLFEPMYTSTIGFQPDSRLVVNLGPGRVRSFRFIRAQGIPTDPERQKVYPGDEGVFKVYFERLEPGMTVFDLFECRSEGSYTCWNYNGVHINNPLRRPTPPPVTPPPSRSQPPAQTPPPVASRPAPVPAEPKGDVPVVVSGQVYDAVTKQPVDASLSYRGNGGVTDSARTIRNLGIYRLTLPKDKYNYTVTAPGYERLTEPLDLTQPAGLTQVDRDIYLTPQAPQARATTPTPAPATPKPVPPPVATAPPPVRSPILTTPPVVGRKVELKNVLFETGKSTLLPDSYATLDDLAQWMQENPAVEIRLEGHTDRLGDPQKNLELSLDRVVAVKRYLTGKGIAPGRIQTKGYGDTRPVTRGTSEAERQKNRRVEFVIVKS